MLTVADELFISGMDEDTRAIIERYVDSRQRSNRPSPEALRAEYERGYSAGVVDARAGSAMAPQSSLPLSDGKAA